MITKWKVFNFKSVKEETELEFAPLTIFAGANSSGKSTFLQTILLVAQTLSHKVDSRSVVLNGAFVRLGQFDDLRSAESGADQIVIGWTCEPTQGQQETLSRPPRYRRSSWVHRDVPSALSSVSCEVGFDAPETGNEKEMTQLQPRLVFSQLSAVERGPDGTERDCFINVRRAPNAADSSQQDWIDVIQAKNTLLLESFRYAIEMDEVSLSDIREELASALPVGCLLGHFLPDRLALGVDKVAEETRVIYGMLVGEGPRGIALRRYLGGDVLVPRSVVEHVLEKAGSINAMFRDALADRLQKTRDLIGSTEILLEHLREALQRENPRMRIKIRHELAETGELEGLVRNALQREHEVDRAVLLFRLPGGLAEAVRYLDAFFSSSVRYLGPLRDEPKSLYPLAPTASPSDVGLKGEHTAAVLELHKNRLVRYIPASAFAEAEIEARPTSRSLQVAVVDWLGSV